MKRFFLVSLAVFAALYLAAEHTLERGGEAGVVRLRWATDQNSARNVQVALFAKLQVLLKEDDVLDWPEFCRRLSEAGRTDLPRPIRTVRDMLGPEASAVARSAATTGKVAPQAQSAMLGALNRIIEGDELCRKEDFRGLALSKDASALVAQWKALTAQDKSGLPDAPRAALNRRVLEAVFPILLRKARRIEVTVEAGAGEKILVQCATATGPDIIDIFGVHQMLTFVEAGILDDLTDQARKMGFSPASTYPAIRDVLAAYGRQYRFPCNVWANCVVYNRAIFDDHGVPYPKDGWTIDEFIETGKRILNSPSRSGQSHLVLANWNSTWVVEDFLIARGGRFFSPDGLVSRLDSPEVLAAMRLYADLMHSHKIIPTPAEAAAMSSQGGWGAGGINWFSGQRAAMIFIGRWYLTHVRNYPDLVGKLGAASLPRFPGSPSSGMADCRGAGVSATSRHKEEAYKFLQYLAGPEYGKLIVSDGDALPPNPSLAGTGADLVNDPAPDAAFHQPFIDAVARARPLDASPFIDGGQVERWLKETVSNVENNIVSPERAMKSLADEINRRIRLNLQRRSDLQRKYRQITGKAYSDDWWKSR